MNTTEEKETKTEVKQIDSLYFVVRELDAIHKRIDRVEESINELRSELKGDINRVETSLRAEIKELRSFMVKLFFGMAGLIIAGVGILFSIIKP